MAARTPNVLNAAIEFGFVAAAAVLGLMHAPLWMLPVLALTMIGYWAFNRRFGLAQARQQGFGRLAGLVVVAVALMSVVLGGAYWLGSIVGGNHA